MTGRRLYGAPSSDRSSTARRLRLNPPFRTGVRSEQQPLLRRLQRRSSASNRPHQGTNRLAALEWADVVLESFTPKALAGWEMDYEHIRRRNPSVVMLSTCMQGQTGPRRLYRGFGNLMAGLAGFYELTGWPDRGPAMIYGAYTDFVSQRFAATSLLAALDHRRRTGEGQQVDLSQLERRCSFSGRTARLRARRPGGHPTEP
jgi:benzylsuccinate CoA-transferase BbsF subunit